MHGAEVFGAMRCAALVLGAVFCTVLPGFAISQHSAPITQADEQASAIASALDAEFTHDIWPVLLRGEFAKGLTLLDDLLARCRSQLGASSQTALKVHYYQASTLQRLGRLEAAKGAFESIAGLHKQAGTQNSRSAISSLSAYARTIEALRSPRLALPIYRQAMGQRAQFLGEDDLESVTLIDDYAGALMESGYVQEAMPLLGRAFDMRVKQLGESHRWTLTTQNHRAQALARLGRLSESLLDNEAVLRQRMIVLGESDPTTLNSMNNTAHALARLGRSDEALVLHQRAVKLQSASLGSDHFSTLNGRRGVAMALMDLGRVHEASVSLRELLDQGIRVWGNSHHHTQAARVLLARALELLGQYPKALAELGEATRLYREGLGSDHFDTLSTGIQHARVLRVTGQTAAAQSLLETIVPRAQTLYGAELPLALSGAAELAACYLDSGTPNQAISLLTQLLAKGGAIPDETDPDSEAPPSPLSLKGNLQRMLARALAAIGQSGQAFAMIEQQKSERLLLLMNDRSAAASAGVSNREASEMQSLRERVLSMRDAMRDSKDPLDRREVLDELQSAIAAVGSTKDTLHRRYPLYDRLTRMPAATPADAGLLPRGSLFISYIVENGSRVSAMTLESTGRLRWHSLGDYPGLAQTVDSLRLWATQLGQRRMLDDAGRSVQVVHWLASGHPRWRIVSAESAACESAAEDTNCRPMSATVVASRAEFDELLRSLGALLLEPMRMRLQPFSRWVISPDIGLGALPFDLLPWRGAMLAQHVAVSQLQSLSVLRATRVARASHPGKSRSHSLDLLAIGNPAFADQLTPKLHQAEAAGQTEWQPLPATQGEMGAVAALFPRNRTRVAYGLDASELHLRGLSASGELAKAKHVLFSTHAWYAANLTVLSKARASC